VAAELLTRLGAGGKMDAMRRLRRLTQQLRAPGPAILADTFGRLTIRAALFLGFGLIFALWLASGYDLVRRLADVEGRASAINARFTQSEEALFTVRTQILLGSIYRRDALLDTDPSASEYYRDQLQQTRHDIEQALRRYVPVLDSPAERENWARLRTEIDDYWDTILPEVTWSPTQEPGQARAFLRRQVIPKRVVIIRILERIQALNRDAFQQQQAELARVYDEMKQRLWWTSGLAVLLGLGIAFLVTRYAAGLEARIRQQLLEDLKNKSDLQRLSARLVHAQEEERRAIARELHDEVGQALTAIKMDLAMAERSLESSAKARTPLEEARSIAERVVQSVRDLSQLLHPAMLDDLGLPDTLNWYLRGFSKRTGIRAELVQDRMGERLAQEVEVCAYRIVQEALTNVQEALTNVAKHAQASRCRVYLQRLPYTLLITVEDDGKGFDPRRLEAGDTQRGLGLVGIQERASGLGGTFRLESNPGKGTRLSVELPALPAATEVAAEEAEAAEAPAPSKPVSADRGE